MGWNSFLILDKSLKKSFSIMYTEYILAFENKAFLQFNLLDFNIKLLFTIIGISL